MEIVDETLKLPLQPVVLKTSPDGFQTAEVVTIAAAHGAHDTYFSFLPTILPLLIHNLALNTAQAGLLTALGQIPSLLQPFIGHLADSKNLKMVVVLAPALSGLFVTLVGIAPSFGLAALLMLLAGFSTAAFHAISPAMVGARSGRKVGRGMGFFMVGGELGFVNHHRPALVDERGNPGLAHPFFSPPHGNHRPPRPG
jgi:FSR family fosmidomycin resistance protein-like MFS transporter